MPNNPTSQASNNLAVAAVQMVSTSDVESNLNQAQQLVEQAAREGAQLIVLPENFAVFNAKALWEWSQGDAAKRLVQAVSNWAKESQVYIVAGTLPLANRYPEIDQAVANKRVRTSSLVFAPEGVQCARYDKIHLFDVDVADAHGAYRESETIEPGTTTVVKELQDLAAKPKLGLSVCYDLRFPELYRSLAASHANIFSVPAAFTWQTGRAHWEALLRARAIENQCFVIAANQGGRHSPTRQTWGHSMIVSPWGEIIAQQEDGPAVVYGVLNFNEQTRLRVEMPVHQHRRL
ncbi:MAG: carbon-nitrogen hydrolase family protein [Pseudomonadales bacterium]|nr:carbon-nitrogen hydrolase family protein [Pseudomonadales bacterium]